MYKDPLQYTNLAGDGKSASVVDRYKASRTAKLKSIRANDLESTKGE